MERDKSRTPLLKDLLLRGLRIGASTIALVELLRSDWIGGGSPAWPGWSLFKLSGGGRPSSLRPENRIDAVRVLTDISVELHGQKPRFKGVRGVEARFQFFSVGCLVADCVCSPSLSNACHGLISQSFQAGTTARWNSITIHSCLRFNAS